MKVTEPWQVRIETPLGGTEVHLFDTEAKADEYRRVRGLTGPLGSHNSHYFVAEADDDNMECTECGCRPYGRGSQLPCPDQYGHGGPA